MKSDVIHVTSKGAGIEEALLQAEKVAAYNSLNQKDSIHLRLFAEEIMGMMTGLTGEQDADFWIESDENCCHLHLLATTAMNSEKREKLLAASTSGKNDVRGFMGKLRAAFESAVDSLGSGYAEAIDSGLVESGSRGFSEWSLVQYKANVKNGEEWDELEHSVVAKLADELRIRITGSKVEMIIDKNFK